MSALTELPWQWWGLCGIIVGGLVFMVWCLIRANDTSND